LAGRNAYLIGFMDDYSRYITCLGLYRSQTAEHVLEIYRRAISEYGVPREVLTDNGRQYTNWRGTTRFEQELQKDRVKHIKSRPHHPMTLGKIERFWKTIHTEFLQRAQFSSYEEAEERIGFWVKYYNYKRPHQGIGGLCPADRFFEIQHALKKTLEQGIEENALELALRGKPRDPFYMVGRMGDQSVVIRAEKGKVKMLLDGKDSLNEKELVYDARKDIDHENSQSKSSIIRSATENHGRVIGVDREAHDGPVMPGDGNQSDTFGSLAKPGHGGDADCPESEETREARSVIASFESADRKEASGPDGEIREATESDSENCESRSLIITDSSYGKMRSDEPAGECQTEGGSYHEGSLRPDDGRSGGQKASGIQKDLLQMGAAGSFGSFGGSLRPESRQAGESDGSCGIGFGKTACRNPSGERSVAAEDDVEQAGLSDRR
jgi:hypothetical protein